MLRIVSYSASRSFVVELDTEDVGRVATEYLDWGGERRERGGIREKGVEGVIVSRGGCVCVCVCVLYVRVRERHSVCVRVWQLCIERCCYAVLFSDTRKLS